MAPSKPKKSLFIFEDIRRNRLFVSKNNNFQTLVSKDWWRDVHHINVKHFDSLDELEDALALAKDKGTKWNAASAPAPVPVSATPIEHDIFTEGFPVE